MIEDWVRRTLVYLGFDLEGDASALTPSEMEQYRPAVVEFIQHVGIGIDWSVTHTNAAHAESDIWMFSDEEASALATIYLKRARKIGWMAVAARQVAHLNDAADIAKLGEMFGKRAVATGMFYASNGGFKPWLK